MLKIAMLGAWHVHAPDYASQLLAHPETEIALVWDNDASRGQKFAQKLGVPFRADLAQVLQDKGIDGVVINTPTNLHHDVIIQAAKAGKHIFTEKVLTPTLAEAHAVAQVIHETGVKFTISFPHRTMPHNLFAKDVVEKGLLGRISLLRIRNAHNGTVANWLPAHFYDRFECGGGAMIDLGAHGMYLSTWLLGKPRRISSMFSHVTGKAVEDNGVTIIEFENEATAINETSFLSAHSPFSLELYGTEGSLFVGGPESRVQLNSSLVQGKISGWVRPDQLPKALPQPIEQWIGAILRDGANPFDIHRAVELSELMDGAYRSHSLRRQIMFPLT
ncbi:MAG TPA: gfo/Idh/MocA family oxidoreductase [Firmicutes bacterium]|nr:gfo/Idh/MocA family oxidoreductase [Bacillota bacterium]